MEIVRRPIALRGRPKVPESIINITYKEYIPEVLEYFRTAERVDNLPFKYLCYYNILEYFLDKSAYYVVAENIKGILLRPDFHLRVDHYVGKAVNIFKRESEKHISDKVKLSRVLTQYLDLDEFIEFLKDLNLYDYFEKPAILYCNKELTLTKIDFNNTNQIINSLTNRIYTVRCSIVHSNPDFDENKAVPFVSTPHNLLVLRSEIRMIQEIAKNIILKSTIS